MIHDKCKGQGREENGVYVPEGTAENAYSSPACSSPRQHSNPGIREEAGMFLKGNSSETTEF
jgi:hypothetical protein